MSLTATRSRPSASVRHLSAARPIRPKPLIATLGIASHHLRVVSPRSVPEGPGHYEHLSGICSCSALGRLASRGGVLVRPLAVLARPRGILVRPLALLARPRGILVRPLALLARPRGILVRPLAEL